MTNLNFDIFGRDHGAGRTFDELARKVEKLQREVNNLDRTSADPNVQLNIREAEAKLKELQADMARLSDAKVSIDVDTTRTRADINAVQRQLAELRAQSADVRVDADVAAAEAKLDELKAHLADLKGQKLNFDADTAAANAKIDALKAKVATIRDVHINVDADVGGATTKLTLFNTLLRQGSDSTGLFSEALRAVVGTAGAVTTALGSVISSGSSMLSALSGGVGIFQALAQGGVQFGASISKVGEQMTTAALSSGNFIQSMVQATAAMVQLALQMTAMVGLASAIAGAVSLLTAGIAQLGGAAVALVSGITPVVQSMGLLPGLIAPLVVGFGALAIGFSNTGKSGLEFKNTMDQLKTAFTPVIDSIRSGMQPAIQNLLNSFKSLAPAIQSVVPQITSAVSEVANSFAQLFSSSQFQNDFKQILVDAANNFKIFGDIGKNAIQGIMNVMVAANPAVQQFLQFIDQGVQKWNAWTAAARQSGELTQIFQQAEQVLEQLIGTIGNVAGLFVDLWNSANRTGAFQSVLTSINDLITRWRDNIQQVGGTWDQLMQRVSQVAPQIMGLIGDIGEAFAKIGANVDLSPAIEAVRGMIPSFTQAFTEIANAASNAFKLIGPDISSMVDSWGPQIATTITNIAQLFHQWAPAIQAAGTAIITVANAIVIGLKGIGTAADATATAITAGWKALHGDIAGASADWGQFEQRQKEVWGSITTGVQGASGQLQSFGQTGGQAFQTVTQASEGLGNALIAANQSVQQYGTSSDLASTAGQHNSEAMTGVVTAANNLMTALANSGASAQDMASRHQEAIGVIQRLGAQMGLTDQQIQTFINQLNGIPEVKNVTVNANTATAMTALQTVSTLVTGIPVPDPILLSGDPSGAVAAAGTATTSTQGIPNKDVQITGNPAPVQGAVGQAQGSLGTLQDKTVIINATDNVTAAATAANNALAGIVDKNVKISATNNDLVIPAQGAVDALNAIVDKNVNITANNSQALQAIQQVQQGLNSLQNKTVTITTVYQTIGAPPGQAAGSILAPRAGGGVTYSRELSRYLPMAPGGMTSRHLNPMSGSSAAIVSPNTWRIIGDRPTGMEAFIPINKSARSQAILAQTARQMGDVVVPRNAIQFHRGGWWRRHRRYEPPRRLPPTIGTSVAQRVMSSMAFGTSGGTASYMRTVKAPMTEMPMPPAVPSTPPSSGGHGGGRTVYLDSHSAFMQEVLRYLRAEIRKYGGDVQVVLGRG